jgi:hypothetical protein
VVKLAHHDTTLGDPSRGGGKARRQALAIHFKMEYLRSSVTGCFFSNIKEL